jgi:hypothetical protein
MAIKIRIKKLGVVVHTYNPSTWKVEAGRSRVQVSLGY